MPRTIVVDDCSDHALHGEGVEVVRLKERLGAAAAKNTGLALCTTKYIWFLDSDTEIINPGMLQSALHRLEREERLAAIGGEVYLGRGGRKYLCRYMILPDCSSFRWLESLKRPYRRKTRLVSTCNVIMRADALRAIGGFCTQIKIHEDKLACFLLRQAGFSLMIDSDVGAVHHRSQSGREMETSSWNDYASNSAFVFGAVSGQYKSAMYLAYMLLSRMLEILGSPKFIYDYVRI